MRKKNFRLGIWGWWQGHNLGDNWIRNILHETFPMAELVPTSVQDFSNYDFMICGGGGLFIYDAISPWNQPEKIKIPFGALGLGAEFAHESNIAKVLQEKANFFFLRDDYSIECMHVSHQAKSYDCTFIKPLAWSDSNTVRTQKVFFVWRDGQELMSNEKFYQYIGREKSEDTARELKQSYQTILKEHFAEILEDDFQTDEYDMEPRMEDAGFVVSGRFHGVVAAIQKGLPFIAIDICPKIRALVKECGLEHYCIKISELDKLSGLIEEAKDNLEDIRSKELQYRTAAHQKIMQDVNTAYYEMMKACKPLRGIHYGSYWMKENDIVSVMADDLEMVSEIKKVDLKIYDNKPDRRVKTILKEPNTVITVLDHKQIVRDVRRYQPDYIVLNSGGLVLEDETFAYLKRHGIKTLGLELSDPDVYPYNGAIYAHKFDLFYTNAKLSLKEQYDPEKVNIRLMPFAASQKHHYYMPKLERKYDIVIVGHARPDRKEIVDRLRTKYKIGAYGNGWDDSLGVVNGIDHVKAINSGKIYLSFAKTVAGYTNVKVGLFEAMACKQVVVTDYMEELGDYFDIGSEVLCYKNVEELEELLDYYLTHEEELEQVRERAYARFLREHTYEVRWANVLKELMV